MCYHPIKIRNPSLYFNEDIDKPYIEVPCGHCEQCQKNKVNDLVTRSYYEWRRTTDKGGFCYFDTLTYAPKNVPMFLGTMTFSRKDLTDFFKRLRISLQRAGYAVTDEQRKPLLRYLVTTEYGEDERFTKRPHYHVLWFVNIPNITIYRFYHYVRQCWKLGFNDRITDVMRHVINRLDGIRYVCKYLTKSSDHVERLQNLLDKYKDEPHVLVSILKKIPDIKPFYRASLGFGSSITDVDMKTLNDYGVPIYTRKGLEYVSIPKYIKYKIHYDKVSHPNRDKQYLYKRNANGISYLVDNLEKVIDLKVLQYENVINNLTAFGLDTTIKETFYNLLDGRSIRDFVIYKNVYKGHMFSDLSWENYTTYYYNWLTFPRTSLSPCRYKDNLNRYLSSHDHAIITDKCNEQWFGFDEIDCLLDYVLTHKNIINESFQIYQHERTEKVHSLRCRYGLVLTHH